VLDLRTSPGMMIGKNPTAKEPWAFEDVAWADIPLALCHIADQIQRERGSATGLAVFAHCIGAVMLSMALLTDVSTGLPRQPRDPQRYPDHLRRLQDRQSPIIERLILSQKGFVVEYTDANILRAYLINYAKAMVTGDYSFRPPMFPKLSSTLYDAFLDALPYPHHEWRHEHPWIRHVPWSGTRRRMDALYERTFNIENIPKPVLHHIDDFFGAMNLETVSQVMHFARFGTITDKAGSNQFVSVPRIQQLWPQGGTLLLNAKDNGMVDPHTGVTMENVLNWAGTPHVHRVVIPGGHQDGLIGSRGVSQALLDAVELFI
jgi:cholesterol oxidase